MTRKKEACYESRVSARSVIHAARHPIRDEILAGPQMQTIEDLAGEPIK
ncbi:hypothetical protein ACFL36_04815 [Thermodesulfobacteriota bacterium]